MVCHCLLHTQSQLTRDDCQPLISSKRLLCLPVEATRPLQTNMSGALIIICQPAAIGFTITMAWGPCWVLSARASWTWDCMFRGMVITSWGAVSETPHVPQNQWQSGWIHACSSPRECQSELFVSGYRFCWGYALSWTWNAFSGDGQTWPSVISCRIWYTQWFQNTF